MHRGRYKCATKDSTELDVRYYNRTIGSPVAVFNTDNRIIWLDMDDVKALRKQLKKIVKEMENG